MTKSGRDLLVLKKSSVFDLDAHYKGTYMFSSLKCIDFYACDLLIYLCAVFQGSYMKNKIKSGKARNKIILIASILIHWSTFFVRDI